MVFAVKRKSFVGLINIENVESFALLCSTNYSAAIYPVNFLLPRGLLLQEVNIKMES